MKNNKKPETETTLIYVWRLFVKNALMHIGDCLFFYSSALPSVLLCLCAKVHEPTGAAL